MSGGHGGPEAENKPVTKFVNAQKMKQCPLCLRKFHIIEEAGKKGKVYFACDWCKIILWVRDTLIGHWDEFDPVPCPTCGEPKMRFFCREDLYCKWYCPKCKTAIENYDPDKHKKVQELLKIKGGGK